MEKNATQGSVTESMTCEQQCCLTRVAQLQQLTCVVFFFTFFPIDFFFSKRETGYSLGPGQRSYTWCSKWLVASGMIMVQCTYLRLSTHKHAPYFLQLLGFASSFFLKVGILLFDVNPFLLKKTQNINRVSSSSPLKSIPC